MKRLRTSLASARARWTIGARQLLGAAALGALLLTSGCATTRAYQREHLADRIMSFQADAKANARAMKALEAREGSTGGSGGAGGGCACN